MNMFSAASHLKSQVLPNLPSDLAGLGDIVSDHLSSSAFGGLARDTSFGNYNNHHWQPIPADPSDDGTTFPHDLFEILKNTVPGTPPSHRLIPCLTMVKSGMKFSVGSRSAHDSQICYKGPTGTFEFGRINSIMVENADGQTGPAVRWGRIFLIVEQYETLDPRDAANDPFRSHPLVGDTGYNLARILYDSFVDRPRVIEALNIVGHIARCSLEKGLPFHYRKPAFVAVQLDRVSLQSGVLAIELTSLSYGQTFIFEHVPKDITDGLKSGAHSYEAPRPPPSSFPAEQAKKLAAKGKRYAARTPSPGEIDPIISSLVLT